MLLSIPKNLAKSLAIAFLLILFINILVLTGMVNAGQFPVPDTDFPQTVRSTYWANTIQCDDADSATGIFFSAGYAYHGDKSNVCYVRAVRSEPLYIGSLGNQTVDSLEIVANSSDGYNFITDGLIAEYLFNGNANDTSGNGNHGIINGPVITEDRFKNAGSAYDFGNEDYIVIKNDPSLNPENQLTIAFWVKVNKAISSYAPILYKGGPHLSGWAEREYSVWLRYDNAFQLASAGDGEGQHVFNSNSQILEDWIFYVGVIDRINHITKIYINGILDSTFDDKYSSFNSQEYELRFGWESVERTGYTSFVGILDDIRIYNRVLSQEEILSLYAYNSANPNNEPDINQDQLCTIKGKIYDSKTGQSVNNVQLTFVSQDFNITKRYQTDKDGKINITDMPAGVYNAQITAQGYHEINFESLSLTHEMIFDITTALESKSPEILRIWSEPDIVKLSENSPTDVTIYAEVTDPDTIKDIKSVQLSLLTNDLDLKLRSMELIDTQNGIYQYKINLLPTIHMGHYALKIAAQDYSEFKDYAVFDLGVIKKITKRIEPNKMVKETIHNILHNQSLILTIQMGKTLRLKKENESLNIFGSGSGSECYVEVNVYDPNGVFYKSYNVYETMDIEIPNAMEGDWTYENTNHCLEAVDVQIEIKGSDTGIITGAIKDSSTNIGIAGADIDWNMGGKVVSANDGNFSFVAIAGAGVLTTTLSGYKNNLRTNISVLPGETTNVMVKLISDTLSPLSVPASKMTELILNPASIPDPETQPFVAGIDDDKFNISACFAPYETPVNLYLGFTSDYPDLVPYFFLFNMENQIEIMGDTLFAWRENCLAWNQIDFLGHYWGSKKRDKRVKSLLLHPPCFDRIL